MSEEVHISNDDASYSLDDHFLFIFSPKKLDTESFCGIPLYIVIRIISALCLLISIYEILISIQEASLIYMLWAIFLSVFFLVISFFTLTSTINSNAAYAKIGYYTFLILFLLKIPFYLIQSTLMLLGFINPYGNDFFKVKAILYALGEGISLCLNCYFIWLLYCYMKELQSKRNSHNDHS